MFITYLQSPQHNQQIDFGTFLDLFQKNQYVPNKIAWRMFTVNTSNTPQIPNTMLSALKAIHPKIKQMLKTDLTTQYYSFKLPKRNGSFRTIDAPKDELKELLTQIKLLFELKLRTLPHDAAYAYTKTRAPLEEMKRHQENESKWFLKLDLKDFFGSCTEEFIYTQLQKIFPFAVLTTMPEYNTIIKDIIKVSLYKGRLPQGTPFSPLLTNLIFIPIDYKLTHCLKEYVYTRYADDILISHKEGFDKKTIIGIVKRELHDTPLKIKDEKTRYGSSAGRNWNLGLMLNKENNITVGHQNKKKFKASIDQFLYNPEAYSPEEKAHLMGNIAYYKNIEPLYIDYIIKGYNNKHNKDLLSLLK